MNILERAAPGAHAHITDFRQLPAYEDLLSTGSASLVEDGAARKLYVPQAKIMAVAVLRQSGRRFFLVSTEAELRSPVWYYLINRGKAMGLEFGGYATATEEVFQMLKYKDQLPQNEQRAAREDARMIRQIVADSSPLEWFRGMVQRCMELGASDIHLELRAPVAALRVRLDGIMRHVSGYPMQAVLDGISAAYTVLAEEHSRSEVAFNAGIPQAAMIPLQLASQKLTLRYQSHPAVGGLDVVIRILKASSPEQTRLLTLERLGFTPWQIDQLTNALGSAWGGVFIAGITGSGKTTTLNTLMARLTRGSTRKLVTIEDPVEYEPVSYTHLTLPTTPYV